jgi:hypothetical protein
MGVKFTTPEESGIQSTALSYCDQDGNWFWKNGCDGDVDCVAGFE